jgi:hypothetical protein
MRYFLDVERSHLVSLRFEFECGPERETALPEISDLRSELSSSTRVLLLLVVVLPFIVVALTEPELLDVLEL